MAEAKMTVSFEIASIAVARPGDTLFIGFSNEVDDELIEALDEHFRPYIEAGIKVGYIDQVASMVVLRPDEALEVDSE